MTYEIGRNLGLGMGWDDGANLWGSPMNRNLLVLDTLAFICVKSREYTSPDHVPAGGLQPGHCYLVNSNSSVEWESGTGVSANKIALYTGAVSMPWAVFAPRNGWTAIIEDATEEDRRLVFLNGNWVTSSSLAAQDGITPQWKNSVDQALDDLDDGIGDVENVASQAQQAASAAQAAALRSMIPPIVGVAGDTTLTLAHQGAYIITTGSLSKVVTLPAAHGNPELNFPIGGQIAIRQGSPGEVSISAPSGVVLNAPYLGTSTLAGPGATATVIKRSDTEWDVAGQVAMTGADSGRQIETVTEGAHYTPGREITRMLLSSSSSIEIDCKITLPLGEYDGQRFSIAATTPLLVEVEGTDTETVPLGEVALTPGASVTFEYDQTSTSWLVSV